MKIVFATNNTHKLREAGEILGPCVTLVTPRMCGIDEDIPEDADTLEGNALQKARYIYERTGQDCFADDTGLEVTAMGGAPGVRSARYAGDGHDSKANMELLLRNMEDKQDRSARFRTVVALILGGKEYLFEGQVRGTITRSPQGTDGFGYDPVFIPEDDTLTFAQMPADRKNRISHRARAIHNLAQFLEKENILQK